jgi:hypothetical protein
MGVALEVWEPVSPGLVLGGPIRCLGTRESWFSFLDRFFTGQ